MNSINFEDFVNDKLIAIVTDEYNNTLIKEEKVVLKNNEIETLTNDLYINKKIKIKKKLMNLVYSKFTKDVKRNKYINSIFENDSRNKKFVYENIVEYQDLNSFKINIPVINDSLNMELDIHDNYLEIKYINLHTHIYNTIKGYKYIIQINNKYISDIKDPVELLTNLKEKNESVLLTFYYKL